MDEKYFQQLENDVKVKLQMKWGVDCYTAAEIINMVNKLCSTRGAALYHISDYLSNNF
jgi:hypothetical protein